MRKKVVFDIECVGVDFEALDEKSQHDLLRSARTDEERAAERERTGLYPVTGQVVAIGMLNPDTQRGKVLFAVDADYDGGQSHRDDVLYVPCAGEKDLLEKFWEDMAAYDQVITFNGRGFDAPYLIIRSMVHEIVPSKDLMPSRYGDYRTGFNAHLDLADQLSFYGAMRRFSLHLYTTALGITSPKQEDEDGEIIDGMAVQRLFNERKFETIADYCMRDVVATAALYERWQTVTSARNA